jgi:hypothetical protein
MKRFGVVVLVMMAVAVSVFADRGVSRRENRLKEYFNNLVLEVGQTRDPAEKRAVLNESLERFVSRMNRVRKLPFLNREQREALAELGAEVQAKQDELNGAAGFPKVADADLDDFAQYMAQDLEQAAGRTYLVLSGAAIIIILVVLLIIIL